MKRCPECGRDYDDDSLRFCLDDGSNLLFGPGDGEFNATKILCADLVPSENETQILQPEPATQGESSRSPNRSWVVALGALIILSLGVIALYKYGLSRSRLAPIKSIAVLPLENLSGDPTQEYFADGMTESLIGDLSQIKSLSVISRRSVIRFKGSKELASEIGAQLGVDAIIEGSVQRADGRVKITTQLIRPATNASMWSRSFESDLKDVLKLQSDVAKEIAAEVSAKLTTDERDRLDSAKPIDPAAHEAYLLGKYYLRKQTDKDLALAIGYFEQVSKIAPDFAAAYAGLSRAWSKRGIWGNLTLLQVDAAARAAAEKALEVDPNNSDAHVALAAILMNRDNEWAAAENEARRAIELDPSNAEAYIALAWVLQCVGRHAEVVPNMETAKRLDPVSTQLESDFGRMLYRARNYATAEMHLKRSIELDPANYTAYGRLGDVYCQTGRFDEAIASIAKAEEINPDKSYKVRLAHVYARMGQKEKVFQILREWNGNVNTLEIAGVYAALDKPDEAFKALNNGIDGNSALLSNAKEEPALDPLRNDPRWKEFLRRMKFPEQ